MRALEPTPRCRQRGLGLIETMVGLVVALLVAVAAIASSRFILDRQRAALDTGTASGNETNALAAIKFEVAQAGFGFFADGRPLCPTMNLADGDRTLATASPVMPLQLGTDASGVVIDVLYASAIEAVSPAPLAAPVLAGDTSVAIAGALPIVRDQAIMLVPGPASTMPCTVRTATAVTPPPAGVTGPLRVEVAAGGAANHQPFEGAGYTTGDFASRLGQLQWSRFLLQDGTLLMERRLTGQRSVVARNVVAFTAEYGLVGPGSSSIVDWRAPSGDFAVLQPADLGRVRALRIGLAVRSAQPERRQGGQCVASSTLPVLFDRPVTSVDPDWACYRYRAGSIVVPLRNFVRGVGA